MASPRPRAAKPVLVAAAEVPADFLTAPAPVVEAVDAGAETEDSSLTIAGLTPEQYPDVFDRIRAGFKLTDIDSRQIDVQLAFFANNPQYLERVFGRAVPYLHHIVQEIEKRGMPLELALLPVVESAFEPYARSWATANGLWQFMPGTGERFGLKQDWWYDGRRDVMASTRAALDYLQYMHDEFFDDWLLAIAAYNCGEFRVQREVNKNRALGKGVDFFSLSLPSETRAYVPKLMAMRRLVANPEDYGIAFSPIPNEPYFARVETGGQLDLTLAAELAGITLDEVYELNPGFHRWATDPAGPHFLLLPRDTADAFRKNLELLSLDERVRVSLHTVKSGESVASIAKKYKTQAIVVRDMNTLERQRTAGGWQRAARAHRRGQSTRQGDARRGARRRLRWPLRAPPRRARGAQRRFAVAHRQAQPHGCRHARAPEWHGARRHAARRPEAGAEHACAGVGQSFLGVLRQLASRLVQGAQRRHAVAHRQGVRRDGLRPGQLERHQQALDAASGPETHGQRSPPLISSPS